MKTILKKLFDIREGEESNTLLMFSYIFLIIASLLIVKPVRKSQVLFGISVPSEIECKEFLLQGEDNWLKACTIHLLAEVKNAICKDFIQKLVDDSDPIVRETSLYYFSRIESI
jgi:hypothetical protein